MSYRVGVDIGGSFADFSVFNEDTNEIQSLKVFSRPDKPGAEVVAGVKLLEERFGIRPRDISYFTHGTTVGINTIIQRKGPKLALFATENFVDVLEIGRIKTNDMYSLLARRPAPLVKRDFVFGISERMSADGTVKLPLDEQSLAQAVAAALFAKVEGIVIAFLHSYKNPEHELRAKTIIQRLAPGLLVTCSCETWPIIREYERTMTALIGAYVQPKVSHYLSALQDALNEVGVVPPLLLTKSNGGVMTAEQGKRDCVHMVLSGTAAGVIGASHVAAAAGIDRCLGLDIGGTSADISVIVNGKPQYGNGELVGDFQIHIPSVSVSSVGEGGGSIAWIDALGVLKVGPESAGSTPGPACYGRGGTRATITDAFVVCGLVGHSELGYSAVKVDKNAALSAVSALAQKLNRGAEQTAQAIIDIAVSGMYSEVSGLVSRFGIDLREFSLLAFGGAGPMMAGFLARELGVREIVIPPSPGTLSALGGLIAESKNDFLKTVYVELSRESLLLLRDEYRNLLARAQEWLKTEHDENTSYEVAYSAEMRYRGQSFELDTPLAKDDIEAVQVQHVQEAFHAAHQRIYGHADSTAVVQVVSARLVITAKHSKPQLARHRLVPMQANPTRQVHAWIDGCSREVPLFSRSALHAGCNFAGPAIVAQEDTTTVILPEYDCAVDEFANLRIVRGVSL